MTVHVLPKARGRKAPVSLPAINPDVLSWLAGDLGPAERLAMREIAERADLIFVDGHTYLIAPVSPACLDALSAFEAEGEGREHGDDDEPSILTYGDLEDDPALYAPSPDYGDDPDQPQYVHPNGGHRYGSGKASPVVVNPATGEAGRIMPIGSAP